MADEQIEHTPEQVVVEGKPVKDEKVAPEKDFASSSLPYHTAETEKIAEDRATGRRPKYSCARTRRSSRICRLEFRRTSL
jgi:hypothetical protein